MESKFIKGDFVYLAEIKNEQNLYEIGYQNYKDKCWEENRNYIIIMECENPRKLAEKIEHRFQQKFVSADNGYFTGDSRKIKKKFLKFVSNLELEKLYISTYKEWKEYKEITNLIITDVENLTGYIKYKDGLWENINNDPNGGFRCELGDLMVSNEKVEYHVSKIRKDIISECYLSNPKFYYLNYHEFILKNKDNPSEYYLLDTLLFQFKSIQNSDLENTILPKFSIFHTCSINQNNTNIDIVSKIVNSVEKPEVVSGYKKLLYNILVKPEMPEIIFHNYNNYFSLWLNSIIKLLSGYISIPFKNRLGIINSEDHKNLESLQNAISNLQNSEIKYIIIEYPKKTLNLETDKVKMSKNTNEFDDLAIRHIMLKDVFTSSDLMRLNFLKWCCTKE